jgi:hypothetical protein
VVRHPSFLTFISPLFLTFSRVHVICERNEGDPHTRKILKDSIPDDFRYNCPKCRVKPRVNPKKGGKKKILKPQAASKDHKPLPSANIGKNKNQYASFPPASVEMGIDS